MENIVDIINKKFQNRFDFLKLYEVCYDNNSLECVVTFLYPQSMEDVSIEDRRDLQNFLQDYLKINGNLIVKFKKSFLDERLIKRECLDFIFSNFKAVSTYLTEEQIKIDNQEETVKICFEVAKEIKVYFDGSSIANKLNEYLSQKFISVFEISCIEEEKYRVDSEVGEVEIPTIAAKNMRYSVYDVHQLFGGDIAPSPEFIADNKEPKSGVILAGKISGLQKKSFTRKQGKRAGEEGVYYTFTLNDGKKIDCVYFSTKANVSKMDFLNEGMTVLCLGDIKVGLSNKLTYYIKRISIAVVDETSKIPVKKNIDRKPVVEIEDFIEQKQENLFTKEIQYNDYIMKNSFVVYDLETTGLDAMVDKIIEIGAVKVENGKVTKKFSTFVNPEMHIPEEASNINNITDEMVADAPKIYDALLDFLNFSKGCIISGYNIINFDNKFISKEAKNFNLVFDNEIIDVFNFARQCQLGCKNYKLGTVASFLGIDLQGAHRAYNDAYATAQVLLKLNEEKP